MDNFNKKIISQLFRSSLQGGFGEKIQNETLITKNINNTYQGLVYNIKTYFSKNDSDEEVFAKNYFTKTIILTYLKTYKIDTGLANDFLASLTTDFLALKIRH